MNKRKEMEKIKAAIIGYGVIGKQLELFLKEKHGDIIDMIYFDDLQYRLSAPQSFPLRDFDKNEFQDRVFYIGMGYKHLGLKMEIVEQLKKNKSHFPSFIHPSSYVHGSAGIGEGTLIYPMCTIGFDVQVGSGTVINNSCVISHDTVIGKCVFLSPSVTICGQVTIGDRTFAGAGTTVSDRVQIGKDVKIGLATAITKNVEDHLSVIGNPMQTVSSIQFL